MDGTFLSLFIAVWIQRVICDQQNGSTVIPSIWNHSMVSGGGQTASLGVTITQTSPQILSSFTAPGATTSGSDAKSEGLLQSSAHHSSSSATQSFSDFAISIHSTEHHATTRFYVNSTTSLLPAGLTVPSLLYASSENLLFSSSYHETSAYHKTVSWIQSSLHDFTFSTGVNKILSRSTPSSSPLVPTAFVSAANNPSTKLSLSTSILTTIVPTATILPSLTSQKITSALTSLSVTPITQNSLMVAKPPHLSLTTPTPRRCPAMGCCTYGLSQLPPSIVFEESEEPGRILASVHGITNVSFTVQVVRPPKLASLLDGVFNITDGANGYSLVLSRQIDLEDLYIEAGEDTDVQNFQLQVQCKDLGNASLKVPPRVLNVTVEDVDDNMPVFEQAGSDSGGCVVPIYNADTAEDYVGELALSPGKIRATDGDYARRNITYRVMHSEPDDYHVYFKVDNETGSVHKTKTMNSSDPSKYVIFVQAEEESPQRKSRVAIVSIVVVAPAVPYTDPYNPNPNVRLVLQIVSALVLIGFITGFVVIVHHRYRKSQMKTYSESNETDSASNECRGMKIQVAVYQSSSSSLHSTAPEIPAISSPSQVVMMSESPRPPVRNIRLPMNQQKPRKLVVKKPLDTKERPGWNAPKPKPKPAHYNPFDVYQKTFAQ